MIKLYIKQAFYQLRENRLISLVSIIGTALAICMIMVIVLVLEVRITDCVPEVKPFTFSLYESDVYSSERRYQ